MARRYALVAIDILGGFEILEQLENFMECDVACRFQAVAKAFRTCAVCHFTRYGLILSRSKAKEVVARMDVSKVQSVSLRNGYLAALLVQAYACHVRWLLPRTHAGQEARHACTVHGLAKAFQ